MRKEKLVLAALIALCIWLAVPAMAADANHNGMKMKPVTVVVSHKVADFAAWEKAFAEHASMREKGGCTGMTVYQSVDDPKQVTIVGTFASVEQAKTFFASEDLKATMEKAGVQGPPEIRIVESYKTYAH